MKMKILRDGDGNLVRAKVNENGEIVEVLEVLERAGAAEEQAMRTGMEREQSRVREIVKLGQEYGAADLAQDAVAEGATVEEFRAKLLDHLNARQSNPLPAREGASDIGMSAREVSEFRFVRLMNALANPHNRRAQEDAAFELEASATAAQEMRGGDRGFVVPSEVLRAPLNTGVGGVNPGDTGGNVIATDLLASSFIDLLRNRSVAMQLASSLAGLVGNITIPKQTAAAQGYWIGEDEVITEDILELGQIGMTPKTVATRSKLTRRLIMQSSIDVEALVRRDLAAELALTIDKAFFYGSGAANQPLGVAETGGINAVSFAAGNPVFAEMVDMETQIAADNADVGSMAYVCNANMRGHLKTTEKFSGSNGVTIWESGNTVNGYQTEVTNQIETGDIFFGNFADALIGMWGGLEIQVDPFSESSQARTIVRAMQDVDFVLRRTESFCLGRNVV